MGHCIFFFDHKFQGKQILDSNANSSQWNNEWYAENVELGVIFKVLRFLESADREWKLGIFPWGGGKENH